MLLLVHRRRRPSQYPERSPHWPSTPSLTSITDTSTVTTPSSYHRDVWAHVLSNKARRGELEPLLACMRFIGSLYAKSDQATELGESVRLDIHTRGDLNPDPALAQCRLLYSIGTYWCGDRDTSRREMDAALGIAVGLGMHCREFTIENSGSGEDPVLAESLRTTW